MAGDVDSRLVGFLQGVFGFADALRDAGLSGLVSVGREDGLRLLQLVAGKCDSATEDYSQRNRPWKNGTNSLDIAGIAFEWPKEPAGAMAETSANDNSRSVARRYGFEEETPALR